MRVRITEPMVAPQGTLNVGDELTVPDETGVEWLRLARAQRIPEEPETATMLPAERAVTRGGRGRGR